MDIGVIITVVISICTTIFGVIGFFLRRAINDVDRLDENKASKEDVVSLENRIDDQNKSISEIRASYLTKEDFFREQAKTDRKLDRIMEILLDIKGGSKHESH